jgi:acyl carrier protein
MATDSAQQIVRDTVTVEALVAIFAEVLQVPVGPDDAFLDLGGDSLTAMSCSFMIRQAFDVELTMIDFLLDDATPRALAARIDKRP